jgi:hypothetical protein
MLTVGRSRLRPMASAISRNGTPSRDRRRARVRLSRRVGGRRRLRPGRCPDVAITRGGGGRNRGARRGPVLRRAAFGAAAGQPVPHAGATAGPHALRGPAAATDRHGLARANVPDPPYGVERGTFRWSRWTRTSRNRPYSEDSGTFGWNRTRRSRPRPPFGQARRSPSRRAPCCHGSGSGPAPRRSPAWRSRRRRGRHSGIPL